MPINSDSYLPCIADFRQTLTTSIGELLYSRKIRKKEYSSIQFSSVQYSLLSFINVTFLSAGCTINMRCYEDAEYGLQNGLFRHRTGVQMVIQDITESSK